LPGSDNLEALFDGQRVQLTPTNGTSAGTMAGTLRANSDGEASGKFMIPSGVRTGTREVLFKNSNNSASAAYTAQGRKRVVEETVLRTRVTVTATDPLAQTFQLDTDNLISSVGLYFATKDSSSNVTVQIRNVVNGYPGNI